MINFRDNWQISETTDKFQRQLTNFKDSWQILNTNYKFQRQLTNFKDSWQILNTNYKFQRQLTNFKDKFKRQLTNFKDKSSISNFKDKWQVSGRNFPEPSMPNPGIYYHSIPDNHLLRHTPRDLASSLQLTEQAVSWFRTGLPYCLAIAGSVLLRRLIGRSLKQSWCTAGQKRNTNFHLGNSCNPRVWGVECFLHDIPFIFVKINIVA